MHCDHRASMTPFNISKASVFKTLSSDKAREKVKSRHDGKLGIKKLRAY